MGFRVGVGTFKTTDRMRRCVEDVLNNGRLSYGPFSEELERRFSEMHGAAYGVLSNSGTSSLHVALQAMKEIHGWQDGDEVIVPAVTFVATVNIVLHNQMTPVLVDVDPLTYNMDPGQLRRALTRRTRCVIPVHLFGQPADMTSIMSLCLPRGIKVIEDSCETVLAKHRGTTVGSMGHIGCFSLYVAHILTAGVGGIATTSYPEYEDKMRSLVNHGRNVLAYPHMDTPTTPGVLRKRFEFTSIGHSFRITELEAALALAQLEDLPAIVEQRWANANILADLLDEFEDKLKLPHVEAGNTHSFMMFPIVLRETNKWNLCQHLEEHGIETREMLPLTDQPCYDGLFRESDYPVAQNINERGFYIGCHQDLTEEDLIYIGHVFAEYFK